MKTQTHNQGELKEVKLKLEKSLVDSLERMAKNSGMSIDEIVCVAVKRFRSSHADYEGVEPDYEGFS